MRDFSLQYISAPAAMLLIGLGLTSDPVRAQTTGPQLGSGLGKFLSPTENAQLCYSGMPGQKVNGGKKISKLLFELGYGNHPASTGEGEILRIYYFNLAITLDDESEVLRASGECSDRDNRAWCGVECDGGGFYFDLKPDVSSIVMAFDPSDPKLRMTSNCENEDAQELELGAHGRGIKLEKVEASICEAVQ